MSASFHHATLPMCCRKSCERKWSYKTSITMPECLDQPAPAAVENRVGVREGIGPMMQRDPEAIGRVDGNQLHLRQEIGKKTAQPRVTLSRRQVEMRKSVHEASMKRQMPAFVLFAPVSAVILLMVFGWCR